MLRSALFPGSFDPLTLGHVDLIERTLALVDRLVIGVAVNIKKTPLFDFDERRDLIERTFPGRPIEIIHLKGLLVEEARAHDCQALIRGIRNSNDFDYEFAMTSMNRALAADIETLFLLTKPSHLFISSSLVKEVCRFGGDIAPFVPPHVADALTRKLHPTPHGEPNS